MTFGGTAKKSESGDQTKIESLMTFGGTAKKSESGDQTQQSGMPSRIRTHATSGRPAPTALQQGRAPCAGQGRTGSRVPPFRLGRQQPGPPARPVVFLRRRQVSRSIRHPAPRRQRLLCLAHPAIHRRQAPGAEHRRLRRRLCLAAPGPALVQPHHRTIPPRQPRIHHVRHRPTEHRHDSDARNRHNRIARPGAGAKQQHGHNSERTP